MAGAAVPGDEVRKSDGVGAPTLPEKPIGVVVMACNRPSVR